MKTVKGLLVMDVDSTLIMEEGIDLLGEDAGVGDPLHARSRGLGQGAA